MAFTTKQILKSDKKELYPGKTVLIQHSYEPSPTGKVNTKFTLNKDAMEEFKLVPYTPNVNNITWGIDSETKELMLAAISGDTKTNKVTADNTFSCQAFLDKLAKQFGIDPVVEHVFSLGIYEENGIFVAKISLRKEDELINLIEEPYPGSQANVEEAATALSEETFNEEINNLHQEGGVEMF